MLKKQQHMLLLPDYRVRQRDLLLEIIRAMTSKLELSEVLMMVLRASVAMVAGESKGLVALHNDSTGDYAIRETINIDKTIVPQLDDYLARLVVAVNEGLKFGDLEDELQEMARLIDPGIRQLFPMPLVIAGEPVGLLMVFRNYIGPTTPNDLQILKSFADQAAIAVHNAQLYERVNRERQRLDAFVRHSADGVMMLDPKRVILQFNPALGKMTGWQIEDAIGQSEDAVIAWSTVTPGNLREVMATGWPSATRQEPLYVEGDILQLDGDMLSIAITYAPLFNSDGELSIIFANIRDITHFRKAQELQNEFISSISHELKTPVALIKGYAGTLRREDAEWDKATLNSGLAVIEDEADRLTELIENLLTTSKLQAEQMRLNLTQVHLDEMITRVVERFRMQSPGHTFSVTFPQGFPPVEADESRLRRVLDNLLSNAVKYSPAGGVIAVSGQASDSTVTVFVRDEGVGISKADQDHIFDRFYRVDGTLTRKTQGTGLGLYLAKAIIEAHNGTIGVESQPNKGSTFYFSLPLKH